MDISTCGEELSTLNQRASDAIVERALTLVERYHYISDA
jgi:hypothetical protein